MAEYGYILSCLSTWASNIGDRKHVCLELYLDVWTASRDYQSCNPLTAKA